MKAEIRYDCPHCSHSTEGPIEGDAVAVPVVTRDGVVIDGFDVYWLCSNCEASFEQTIVPGGVRNLSDMGTDQGPGVGSDRGVGSGWSWVGNVSPGIDTDGAEPFDACIDVVPEPDVELGGAGRDGHGSGSTVGD